MVKTVNSLKGHYWLGCSRCWRKCNDGSFITAAGQFYGRGRGYCKHSHAAFVFNCNADLLRIVNLAIYMDTNGFIGLIWFEAALFLVAGTWIGLYFQKNLFQNYLIYGEAKLYPLLLIIVLLVMLFKLTFYFN